MTLCLGSSSARGLLRALQQQLRCVATLSSSFTELPVIDVGPLTNPSSSAIERQAVGEALHDASLKVGFFYVSSHGLPTEVTDNVMAEARRWFALPEAEKRRIALTPASAYRGWQRLGSNVTQGRRDLHEGIDLYKEVDVAALAAAGLPPSPIHGLNPWPPVASFEAALRRYVAGCLQLGAAVLRGIALGLRLPEAYFEGDVAGDSYWVSRILYYPSLPAPPADGSQQELSCGEHTDYGLLTLVFQEAGVTALQVQNAAGRWVDAPPLPGTCVVNIGDMFRVLTNGMYTPTVHRVVNASGRDRVSVPFFYETNFEAVVSPHPQFCKDRPPQYEQVRYGSHLESKVLNNFDFKSMAG